MKNQSKLKSEWTLEEVREIYTTPFLLLVARASALHQNYHSYQEIQKCTLLSIKTGGCPEDCAYCPQAARYHAVKAEKLMDVDEVVSAARRAKESGATRFCMGAAWREVRDNRDFDNVLAMVSEVNAMDLEVCCTLGMVTESQAQRLADAGLYAYNHNLDSSEEFYEKIISTRTYDDRLQTIRNVRKAGITVCCGGIVGMGESIDDRVRFLHTLASLDPHPESVPINALVPVDGTPLQNQRSINPFDLIRVMATARILMPASKVRLSAGRMELSHEAQALAFLAGANSVFLGEKLLTTPNPDCEDDQSLFETLGVQSVEGVSEFRITETSAE